LGLFSWDYGLYFMTNKEGFKSLWNIISIFLFVWPIKKKISKLQLIQEEIEKMLDVPE
jgi:hypothetical protein